MKGGRREDGGRGDEGGREDEGREERLTHSSAI